MYLLRGEDVRRAEEGILVAHVCRGGLWDGSERGEETGVRFVTMG